MNWYKKAQEKPFFSDDSYGNFSVTIDGKTYNYYEMSPYQVSYYKKLFRVAPGKAFNELKNSRHSQPEKYKELSPVTRKMVQPELPFMS